jgi:Ca2+-binding RTX toxin-like protein
MGIGRAVRIWLLASVLAAIAAGPAGAATFSNQTPINLPACVPADCALVGSATPYPSTIGVSGLPDGVTVARATLRGLTHEDASDVDLLLVGPGGQDTILMHGVCAGAQLSRTLTFADAATASLPLSGPCPSGTYKPSTSPFDGLLFPPNAPPGPYELAMSAFNGGPANGTWRIFASDSDPSGGGVISGGWSIELATGSCAGKTAFEPGHVGTAGNDVLTGTSGPDVMLGLGGRDTINGLGGKDVICGGDGKDLLLGGPGKDKLKGQGGKDTLKGQGGNDTCVGGKKPDTAKGCESEKSI